MDLGIAGCGYGDDGPAVTKEYRESNPGFDLSFSSDTQERDFLNTYREYIEEIH